MVWWLLSTLWSFLLWLVLYIAQYLFAPVIFIAGWVTFISVVVYAYWIYKYGFTAATSRGLEAARSGSAAAWSIGQRIIWFVRGVHATHAPSGPVRTIEVPVYTKRSFTRKFIGASFWMLVGGFLVNEWHVPGTVWPLVKAAFGQVMRLWA
ncbi:MAG: hypothetical protein KBE09_01275 [Candidatus Pacebacteria bacterium]|nr:hypothetical protein [Candidatus Paceibacterota bacterium]